MHIFFTHVLIGLLLLPKMMVVAMVLVAWAGMYSILGRGNIVAMIAQEWRGEWDKFICTIITFVVIYVVIEYLKKELQKHKKSYLLYIRKKPTAKPTSLRNCNIITKQADSPMRMVVRKRFFLKSAVI